MIDVFKKQRITSLLGLAWDGTRLEGVVLRRANGSLRKEKAFAVPLALNPLTGDPQLVGREIRNHLEQAGIRERRCIFALPTTSALMMLAELPDLPEEDIASFLQIEAERGFPYGQESLVTASLRFRTAEKKRFATLMAFSRNEMLLLESALKAAQLKPVAFSPGIVALHSPDQEPSKGVLAIAISENAVDLEVTCGGGIAALRALDGAFETEGVQKRLSADFLAREIRITLGQLPAEIRDSVREVKVFGRGEPARQFVQHLTPVMAARGVTIDFVERYPADTFGQHFPAETEVSPAFSLAARFLTTGAPAFDFLPPKVTAWQQWSTRFSSRKLLYAGAAAGLLVLLVGGAFAFQQWQLSRLQSQWAAMEPTVLELEGIQHQIKQFRPWFDNSFRSLSILRGVTQAFPEEGSVSAKTLEIRDSSVISCSGIARDNQAFLRVFEALRTNKEVANLKVDQVRGKTPMQFTFNFHWNEGGAGER